MPLCKAAEILFYIIKEIKHFFAPAGAFFRPLRGREAILQPPLLFLSAKEKEERPAGVEEKEGFFAFGLYSNSNRCSVSFVHFPLLLRAPPERCCGREKLCVYPLAPEWAEPLRVAKAMLSRSKATISVKVSNRFQFPLWRIIRMCIFSLSAAAPWAKQYLPHPSAAAV